MLRAAVLAVLVASLLAVSHAPEGSSADSEVSTPRRIGTWAIENENSDHSYTRAEALADARSFTTIHALRRSYRGHVQAMRDENPSLRLFVYVNGAYAQAGERSSFPDSWYVRDASGRKIQNDWGLWLMDPRREGWVEDRVATCRDFLAESRYDGCFLDNLGPGAIWKPSLSGEAIDPRTGRPWADHDWLAATTQLAGRVRSAVSPAPVSGNGLGAGHAYFDDSAPTSTLLTRLDAGVAEAWIRPAWQPLHEHRPEASWRQDVDMLLDAARRGTPVNVAVKAWAEGSAEEKEKWHEYALASFLLADDGMHRFTFSASRWADPTVAHPWWDVDLGPADGPYEARDGVYQRSFQKGHVLVNPTSRPRDVVLDAEHRDLRGNSVRRVVLAPHTGRILTSGATDGTASAGSSSGTAVFEASDDVDASGDSWRAYTVHLEAGRTARVQLRWSGSGDLNLGVGDPSGDWVRWAHSRSDNPEELVVSVHETGSWRLGITARTGSGWFTVRVE